ncbi:MAG TPA: STT3 domain-containing protein [Conexivisphaerales archaeon]|nr:STT3 domain-containing protein [Conexivisphaerales archaeon]
MDNPVDRLRTLIHRPTIKATKMAAFLAMALTFAIAMIYRLQPAQFGYTLDEFDSYFHYYATNIIVTDVNTKGLAGFLNFFGVVDKHFWYPVGYNMATETFAGFYYTTATLYEFLTRVLGISISLFDYTIIQPAYFGTLIIIPVFLLGRKIKGTGAGVAAALFTILTPGFLLRSSVGWYKHEPLALFLGVFALYFALEAYEATSNRKMWMWSILSGLTLGYANVSWGGGQYFNGLLGLMFIAIPLLTTVDFRKSYAGFIILFFNIVVGSIFPNPGIDWFRSAANVVFLLGVLGGLLITYAGKRLPDKDKVIGKWGTLVGMGVLAIAVFVLLPPNISARYLSVIDPFYRTVGTNSAIVQSVAEHQSVSGIELLDYYSIVMVLAIAGSYYMIKKRTAGGILAVLAFLSSLYVASSFARLGVYLSITAALAGGYMFSELTSRYIAMKSDPKRKSPDTTINARKAIIAFSLIFLIFFPAVEVWYPFTNRPMQISSSATILPEDVPDWQQALTWINTNTPPDAKIISWWDYGYWITVMGNRTTFTDNGTLNTTRIAQVADMYMSNSTNALKIAEDIGGDYVVVFATGRNLNNGYYILGRVYSLGGDDGKFDQMARIANESYGNVDLNSLLDPNTLMPTYTFWNSTLMGELLPFNFTGYAQIDSSTGQISTISPTYDTTAPSTILQLPFYTYQITFPTGAHPFELVFKSAGSPDTNGYFAQVLIYKINP